MTEKLHLLQTHLVAPSQTTLLSPKSTPALLHHVPSKAETVEEEPYTIKCICGFADDDGNTIYCETCDTWQHIECFYPHNIEDAYAEDFAHSCADCKPRPLNPHHAHERQRQRRTKVNTEEVPERKPKRPPSKTHKKRSKPTDLQLNGHSGSDSTIKQPHDSHHKKSKSTHRPNHSISSQPAKRSPSESQKNVNPHGHPPSPATTPPDLPADFEIHEYSSGFLSLYNDDRDMQIVQTNSFASLPISNALSLWTRDHDKLRHETGCEYDEVFQNLPSNIDAVKMTPVVEQKKHIVAPDTVLHWRYLSTPHAIDKDIPLIELNGQIGIQKEYCEDPGNRWAELSSPLPFVFFHPDLPLYIDTRKEGSLARYVRRSCKPNAVLDTYLSGGSEYHFWLVSDRNIAPNEQITIPWDFRLPKPDSVRMLRLLGLRNEEAHHQPEFDPNQMEYYQHIASWLYQILSEYGGCACDLGPECAFARFHRTFITRSHSRSVSGSKKKPRKPKTHAVSPTSAGNPANSRAPSEGHLDDGGDNDSGSSRSKPPSRDMTPARQGSFDTLGILTEPTDRDKRKVAMVEDSFRRMEQQQPARKKKRTSDGNTSSGTTKARSSKSHSQGPNGTSERRYVDAGTNRSMSGSPSSSVSPHTTSRGRPQSSTHHWPSQSGRSSEGPQPEYRDASVQTDHVDGEWFSPQREVPKPKKRIVSLSKRLLESRHRLRADGEERRGSLAASPTSVTSAMVKMDLESPSLKQTARFPSPEAVKEASLPVAPHHAEVAVTDIAMVDAPPVSPTDRRPSLVTTASSTSPASNAKSPDLRVQMPPPSMFHASSVSDSPNTPASTAGVIVPSPFQSSLPNPFGQASLNGTTAQPSPVKKKLSLSDYTKSRMNKAAAAAAAAKPTEISLKPPTVPEGSKSPSSADVAMLDCPAADKSAEA